jgi:hypothetical protein
MKEGGDCSSERWRRHGRTTPDARSTTPEWAALPPELVQHIASSVLSTTGGVDAYMDMRAVCPTWRSAIAKPSPLAAFADLRFRPRHWVMVDLQSENHDDDGACLFLHATTGRFRRLRLLVLRDHLVLGASDGLIVLRDKEHPHLPHVLNPLTGGMLHFAAPLWEHLGSADVLYTAVSGGPRSTLVVWRKDWEWRLHTVIYADPTSPEFRQQETGTELLASMVTFQGNVYYADPDGWVFQFVAPAPAPAEQCDHQFVVIAHLPLHLDIYLERDGRAKSYLVESAGELLLVRYFDQNVKVFRVDVENKLLEEVKSIGSCCALFLGKERCVSVDADKLPSVDGDCIYMFNWVENRYYKGRVMHVYSLRDKKMEIISNEPKLRANNHPQKSFHEDPWFYLATSVGNANSHHLRPHSLIQVLLNYCNDFLVEG